MPFIFGMLAGETDFTNRSAETEHLTRNFEGGINTILISPMRWGKPPLVAHAGRTMQRKNKKPAVLVKLWLNTQFYLALKSVKYRHYSTCGHITAFAIAEFTLLFTHQ